MKVQWGEIMTEADMIKAVDGCDMLISVGDVVSLAFLQNGIVPHITIYDRSTERKPMTTLDRYLEGIVGRDVTLKNEPGTISPEMVKEVVIAIESMIPTMMLIEGEEDLAALVCAALAPDRSCLVYGVPKRGMTLVRIDVNVREKAKKLIYEMEESN
jgi:uncharacterized protein (UPF0218 family)